MQVQHMMIRYDYTSRSARLRNRIARPYHQNSKHESLPSGCLLGFCSLLQHFSIRVDLRYSCSFNISKFHPMVVSVVSVVFVVLKISSSQTHRAILAIRDIRVRLNLKLQSRVRLPSVSSE